MVMDYSAGLNVFAFWTILYLVVATVLTVLVVTVLILLIRYLLAATRAAKVYVEAQLATTSVVEAPPPTRPAPRTRKSSST
jgi:fatty acid desaturase